MTHFEQTYLMNKPRAIAIVSKNNADGESGNKNVFNLLEQSRADMRMQLQYRELDRLSRELEKELQQVKELRLALEKYKIDFSIEVQDEATKKIQEVFNNIQNIIK